MFNIDIPNVTASDTILVNAPSGKYAFIRVWGYDILAGGAANISLNCQPGGGGTVTYLDGPKNVQQGGGLVKDIGSNPWYDLPKGYELHLSQDASATLGGQLTYTIEMF